MSKGLKYLVLYTAAFLLLLHNLTPHQHHGEMSWEQDIREHTSPDIFDLIKTIFHENLGDENHLENITLPQQTLSQSNSFSPDDAPNLLDAPFLPLFFNTQSFNLALLNGNKVTSTPNYHYTFALPANESHTYHSLRAPPYFS